MFRTHKGYVVFYPKEHPKDYMKYVQDSNEELNQWLEKLFSYV